LFLKISLRHKTQKSRFVNALSTGVYKNFSSTLQIWSLLSCDTLHIVYFLIMATASELLTAVNEAIRALSTNKVQSYEVEGVSYTYFDLDKLRTMRKELQAECRTTGGTIRLADVSDA